MVNEKVSKTEKIAVIRIRGIRSMEPKIKIALEYLRLHRPHHCVILNASPQTMGAINKVRDYVAYGAVDEQTLSKLLLKRGEKGGKLLRELKTDVKKIVKEFLDGKKLSDFIDPVFRLHPPRGGYKDIKIHYPYGDLGKRDDINNLLKRMM